MILQSPSDFSYIRSQRRSAFARVLPEITESYGALHIP